MKDVFFSSMYSDGFAKANSVLLKGYTELIWWHYQQGASHSFLQVPFSVFLDEKCPFQMPSRKHHLLQLLQETVPTASGKCLFQQLEAPCWKRNSKAVFRSTLMCSAVSVTQKKESNTFANSTGKGVENVTGTLSSDWTNANSESAQTTLKWNTSVG